MTEPGAGGKLHIDNDWKTEAQQEKDRLAREEQAAAAQRRQAVPDQISIMHLINMLAMQAVCIS